MAGLNFMQLPSGLDAFLSARSPLSQSLQASNEEAEQYPMELQQIVRALVANVLEQVVVNEVDDNKEKDGVADDADEAVETTHQVSKPSSGSRIQVMLWVDDKRRRVALSLFLPREITAPAVASELASPVRLRKLPHTNRAKESIRGTSELSGSHDESLDKIPEVGLDEDSKWSTESATGPQGGDAHKFPGIRALPRAGPSVTTQRLRPGSGLVLGAALMEGYAGVDNNMLADMNSVLRGNGDCEVNCHRLGVVPPTS
eukprot:scaffold142054_cov51-Prasinocladus_malaysianus.AAC.6